MWRNFFPRHFSTSRNIHAQFCSHISQEAKRDAPSVIVPPAASCASAMAQSPAARQPAQVSCSCLGLAEQGQVMGLHCSQGKCYLQGSKVLQARCSAADLFPPLQYPPILLPIPHMLRTQIHLPLHGLAPCCFFSCRRSYFRNILSKHHSWHGHPRHQSKG